MKKIMILMLSIALTGCILPKQKTTNVSQQYKQDPASVQQKRAADAFDELDKETGGKDKDEPVVEMPKKKIEEPVAEIPKPIVEPEKPVIKKTVPKRVVGLGSSMGVQTKYPVKDGYPVWFLTPNMDGYLGAVGIARKQLRGGVAAQKRIAKALAQSALAKQVRVVVDTELKLEQTKIDTATVQYYRSKLSTLSKHKTEEFLKDFVILDEWINPDTEEYYVWMVLNK